MVLKCQWWPCVLLFVLGKKLNAQESHKNVACDIDDIEILEAECQFHCKATIFILIISDWAIKMCFWLRTETCRFKGFVLVLVFFWTGIRKNISAVLFNNKCRSNISVEVIGKIVLYFVADKYKYLVIKHSDNI